MIIDHFYAVMRSGVNKVGVLFSHRPLQNDNRFSCRHVTTPTFRRRLSSVLSKFSHKLISFGCHSQDGVTQSGPPITPLVMRGVRYVRIHVPTASRMILLSINQSINKFIAGNKAHKHTDTQTNRKTKTHIISVHFNDRKKMTGVGAMP